jgi:hypothetical protein
MHIVKYDLVANTSPAKQVMMQLRLQQANRIFHFDVHSHRQLIPSAVS